jgi:hypothetical protein
MSGALSFEIAAGAAFAKESAGCSMEGGAYRGGQPRQHLTTTRY